MSSKDQPESKTMESSKEQSGCSLMIPSHTSNDALQSMLDRLAASNLSNYVEIPMICVLGGTSSGKSSLLSSLSGVELPSSHTLTTRCPVLLQTTRGVKQQARIRIQWKKSYNGNHQRPEYPVRVIEKDDWHMIPTMLLEAQDFILQQYVPMKKEIASDLITLHIQGPDYARLSLLDLPGLVYTKAEHEDRHMIRDIQSLLDEYLNSPRCILLAVVPANVDFHNSTVMAEALLRDARTERTIPVITKPDLIDPGAEGQVADLLLGEKVTFSLGFHMVKGRGQAALDRQDSIDDGLEDEERFFESVEPWRSIVDRSLLGTSNLRDKLAALQMNHTRRQIPGIVKEIRDKQRAASETLKAMGVPLTSAYDRRRYFQDVCHAIVSRLEATVSGKGRLPAHQLSAAAQLHQAASDFVEHIQQSSLGMVGQVAEGAPVLVLHPRGIVRGEVVHLEKDFACVDRVDDADAESDVLFESIGLQPSEEMVEEDTVWSDGSKICIARKEHQYDTLRKIPIQQIQSDSSWLTKKIQENRTEDLPCFLNADTFKSIVADFIDDDWKPHCLNLLEKTQHMLTEAVHDAIGYAFASERYLNLRFLIEHQCRLAVDTLAESVTQQLLSHLDAEKHPFTSQADDLFKHIAEGRQAQIKRDLEAALRVDQDEVFGTQDIKVIIDKVFQRGMQRSMDEYLAEEMELILKSYGSVATKRILDRVPMICWEFTRSLTASVRDSLWSVKDEALEDCMQESPGFAYKYARASEELEELNKAIDILQSLI
ncbi:hypothetical protein MPSEU_000790800 [Mayamaea pseudoterrestris]|nr:hypothetical protein MPSEU_000790800 [Mayamaea pseudoterrestris]